MKILPLFTLAIALQAAADVTINTRGLTLHVEATEDTVRAEGLPVVTRTRDTNRRLLEVRANGRPLLSYHRNDDGRLTAVTVGGTTELSTEPIADPFQETLRDSDGRVLHSSVVPATYGMRVPEALRVDLLNDPRIGAADRWKPNDDGTLHVIPDNAGKPLYYAVVHGPDRVVFDVEGRAVLYDLDLLGAMDQGPASAVFFSRLVVNSRGDVEAIAPFAPSGAVLVLRLVNGRITYELSR
jgi:hypothetical protein